MSKQSPDRRSYSVDEMMDRLKEGEREKRKQEESELVTRPDGSKVVRVRRRKRRSKQPHKSREVRRKRTGLVLLVGAVVLVVALAAVVLVLLARFNSKGYRDEFKGKMAAAIGAKVGIGELKVVPFRARAESAEFHWPGSGVLKSLKLEGISAAMKASSFLGADWNGEVVSADAGTLILGPPDPQSAPVITEGAMPLSYESYRCGNLRIAFGVDGSAPSIEVDRTEVTLRAAQERVTQLLVNGGKVRLGRRNELKIERGLAEMRGDEFTLVSLRLSPVGVERGEATIRTARPMRANSPADLEVELADYSLAHLLGGPISGLGRLVGGIVETLPSEPGQLTADLRLPGDATLDVAFRGAEGSLANFPFLAQISGILRSSDYSEPNTGEISGRIQHDRTGISLRGFRFETKSLLRVEGDLTMQRDESLAGTLRVGLPAGLFRAGLSERLQRIFSEPQGGYSWIELKVSGTIADPRDDFTAVLGEGSPAIEPASPPSGGTNGDLLEDAFRRLTEEPAE